MADVPRHFLGWLPHLFTTVLFPGSPDTDTRVRRFSLAIVLLLPAVLLYPNRGFHLLEPDEGRYAQIPREMLESGEWVVPTLQGEAYLDKPPLMYWLVALSYRLLGVSPESARLVPALCVHLTILLAYLLGRRSLGERAAFWAAMLLTVAPGFVGVARLLLLDGLLVFCIATSVLCGFEAVRTGRLKLGWWLAAAVASGLGFLTKGPISEVLLFVPLFAFGWLTGRSPARLKHYVLFFAIVFLVNLPWYVAIYLREPAFLRHFFWEHNVMRFLQPFDHLQPVWYYAPILLAGLLPGTLLLVPYIRNLLWEGEAPAGPHAHGSAGASPSRPSLAGGFWFLAGGWCVLFFSVSGSKLPTYILPAYPFLCLALGEFLARSRWNAAPVTRVAFVTSAALIFAVHQFGLPWYARERSPFGRPDLVARFVNDRETPVICYPRNCDSLAFYTGRHDFDRVRTKDVNQLYVDCHHRPRTVILFTHSDSLAGFRNSLPPSLEILEETTLKRKHDGAMTKLLGKSPWGLCDVAVVVPKGERGRNEDSARK
ncbi:MAG: glycosyltransferase family 39 protein [Gemmataceae bacterium]